MGSDGEKRIAAGPLFLFGAGLFLLGLVRRRLIPLAAGGAAMWLDRESLLSGLRGEPSAPSWAGEASPPAAAPAPAPPESEAEAVGPDSPADAAPEATDATEVDSES